MKIVRTKAELREALAEPRREGKRIGLVPTMGYFHEGHLSLMRRAREDCDVVVVSLFVNPTQFGPERGPRRLPARRGPRRRAGRARGRRPALDADAPRRCTRTASRPRSRSTPRSPACSTAPPSGAAPPTSAASRPSSPSSSTACSPTSPTSARKDAQQAVVIERMARDLDFPVEIEVLPTVREADGLALSSRNAYLDRGGARAGAGALAARCARPSEAAERRRALDRGARRRGRHESFVTPGSIRSTWRRATRRTSPRSPS